MAKQIAAEIIAVYRDDVQRNMPPGSSLFDPYTVCVYLDDGEDDWTWFVTMSEDGRRCATVEGISQDDVQVAIKTLPASCHDGLRKILEEAMTAE